MARQTGSVSREVAVPAGKPYAPPVDLEADGGLGHALYPFKPLSTNPWMIWRWKIA